MLLFDIAHIQPALLLELLIIFRADVELGPDRNHNVSIKLIVKLFYHACRVGEAVCVEIVVAPFVFRPVEPVLHDIVQRDLSFAKFFDDREQLFLCLVAFAALPEAHRPLRHHRGLAGDCAIPADDLV